MDSALSKKRFFKKLLLAAASIFITLTLISPLMINVFSNQKIYSQHKTPSKRVAIVFGAAVWNNQIPSDVLADRIKIAADLYKSGKIEKVLLSGDNSLVEHNEPQVMKKYAQKLGINEEDIQLDYAGFRTYDTCERAKQIFSLNEALLITQTAHLQRAIFLCQQSGIASIGVASDLRNYENETQQTFREWFAKMYAFWEGYLFRHQPKFLGDKIEI